MNEIIIFILGINAGIGLLYVINPIIREEIKKQIETLYGE